MSKQRLMVALTTTASEEDAERLSRTLVEERLAACVNRIAAASTYRWRGAIEEGSETLLVIKTTGDRVEGLRRRIEELSAYEVPEFVCLEAREVSPAYLSWALASVRP